MRKIERLKFRIYNLGFTKRGLADLQYVHHQSSDPFLKRLAAWELALWHANQYNADGARQCLKFLPEAIRGEKDRDYLRKATILEAECYEILGEIDEAKRMISQALSSDSHTDLFLAAANLESSLSERLKWINQALDLNDMTRLTVDHSTDRSAYDSLKTEDHKYEQHGILDKAEKQGSGSKADDAPKVTVIMPAYNAGEAIRTSLGSVLVQTWRNLEVIVVDDCSTDATASIVEEYVRQDHRVQLIRAEVNGGVYVSRNLALRVATGDYVTVNDADDWSHPEKIEKQVMHLMKHPAVMGNTSQQARAMNDLKFYRRGKPGLYMFSNMSSFMFRREPVMKAVGFWDSVRFGGDSEFIKRIKKVFGEKTVVELPTGPLSFQRQSETSLTGHSAFGFPGYFMGARKEYAEAHDYFHEMADSLYYDFPQKSRPFAVPEPMWPMREEKPAGRRHFDVIIVSEFRLLGGTNMSNIEEIKAQKQMGLRTGLIQMSRYDLNSVESINPRIRELVDGDQVQMLVYGEKVRCDLLIVRHPPILQEWQHYIPDVQAQSVCVIVNQPPQREYSATGETLYHIERCAGHLQEYFGQKGTWYPIGPLIRETLHKHHTEALKSVKLAKEDWVNIIDVEEWRRSSRPPRSSKIRIGRHSRSQYVKWPADQNELLLIYPDSEEYEIHVLGGAQAPRKILGRLPSNWHVLEFGEEHPRDFLAKLDVFVYYTHPDWVEAFGRVIFEAMAVGVPVIIPPRYKDLFGEAAIYAEPGEVQEKIKLLMNDDDFYASQIAKAHAYVENHFGYSKHVSRLDEHFLDQNTYTMK